MFLRNRTFLALLAGLFFMLAKAVFPEFPFSEEQIVAFVALLATYIVGEGLEGKRIIDNFWQLFKSRKFLAVIAGLIVIVVQSLNSAFAVSPEQLTELFILFGAVIANAGVEALKK